MTARHGAVFTAHTAADADRVVAVLGRHVGPERAATWRELARECGLSERRLRHIATERDGSIFLLGKISGEDGGLFLCETAGQAVSLDSEINTKLATSAERQRRRAAYAAAMRVQPVEQLRLSLAS